MKTSKKKPTSFNLTVEDKQRLSALAQRYGISQAGVIELITREAVRHYSARYDPMYQPSSRYLQHREVNIPHTTLTLSQEAHEAIAALAQHLQLNKTGVLNKLLVDQCHTAGLNLSVTSTAP